MSEAVSLRPSSVFVRYIAGGFAALAAVSALAAEPSPCARLSFTPSLHTGVQDVNGKTIFGTEVMHLVAHQGRLYASTSLWMESDPGVPKAAQVLVLDSPKAEWRIEKQFTANNLRWGSLREVTFTTDAQGHPIPPVPLLLAAPDVIRGKEKIFCRNDQSGEWEASEMGTVDKYATTRSIGLHRDKVTGVDRVIAGNDHFGVRGGGYDPAAPGRIRWDDTPEFETPAGERVMGFCQCDGEFYCATSRHIFQRTDGPAASWKQVYFCPEETSPCGIRGLSAVPGPDGQGEVLLFAALSRVRRLDPRQKFQETIEMNLPEFLTAQLKAPVSFALSAYNEFMPYTAPDSGERFWMFGFECIYKAPFMETNPPPKLRTVFRKEKKSYFAAEARYCIRHAGGQKISYEVAEVSDPTLPPLVATRAMILSPFVEDQGRAFYFCGYDCNSIPSHNTGWIYRGELR